MKIKYNEDLEAIVGIEFCCHGLSCYIMDFINKNDEIFTIDIEHHGNPEFILTQVYKSDWYGGGSSFKYCPFCGTKIIFEECNFLHETE
jgi:hypothetical protein